MFRKIQYTYITFCYVITIFLKEIWVWKLIEIRYWTASYSTHPRGVCKSFSGFIPNKLNTCQLSVFTLKTSANLSSVMPGNILTWLNGTVPPLVPSPPTCLKPLLRHLNPISQFIPLANFLNKYFFVSKPAILYVAGFCFLFFYHIF